MLTLRLEYVKSLLLVISFQWNTEASSSSSPYVCLMKVGGEGGSLVEVVIARRFTFPWTLMASCPACYRRRKCASSVSNIATSFMNKKIFAKY